MAKCQLEDCRSWAPGDGVWGRLRSLQPVTSSCLGQRQPKRDGNTGGSKRGKEREAGRNIRALRAEIKMGRAKVDTAESGAKRHKETES